MPQRYSRGYVLCRLDSFLRHARTETGAKHFPVPREVPTSAGAAGPGADIDSLVVGTWIDYFMTLSEKGAKRSRSLTLSLLMTCLLVRVGSQTD